MGTNNYEMQDIAEQVSAAMHDKDNCAQSLGIQIDRVSPGTAKASMRVKEEYANGHGYCQGGIITTFADTAFAHACNSYNDLTVAQGLSIEFVRSVKIGELLTASAKERYRGKKTGVYDVDVRNATGKLVAVFSGKSYSRGQAYLDISKST